MSKALKYRYEAKTKLPEFKMVPIAELPKDRQRKSVEIAPGVVVSIEHNPIVDDVPFKDVGQ